jgi:hypothetical protein
MPGVLKTGAYRRAKGAVALSGPLLSVPNLVNHRQGNFCRLTPTALFAKLDHGDLMTRNCPHCGAKLSIQDNKITGSVALLKCAGCQQLCAIEPPLKRQIELLETARQIEKPWYRQAWFYATSVLVVLAITGSGSYALYRYALLQEVQQAEAEARQEAKKLAQAAQATAPVVRREPKQTTVQVNVPSAILRSGPGSLYRRVSTAAAELQLIVLNEKQDWLEIKVKDGSLPQTAWIRKDLVRKVTE